MKSSKGVLIGTTTLILSMLACNFNIRAPSTSPIEAAGTIVAMTLGAQGVSTSAGAVKTPSSSPSPAPVSATPTTKPTLVINVNNADCRTGPSANTKLLTSLNSGTTVDLIAKDTADGYWLVKDPASGSSCWVRVQDATPGGSFDLLPEVTPQATSGANTPAKPGSSSSFNYWEYSCGAGSVTVNLHWIDAANNENGYHIYRLGQLIADLPANSTTYSETINTTGGNLSYSIRSYNDAGESAPLTTPSFSC